MYVCFKRGKPAKIEGRKKSRIISDRNNPGSHRNAYEAISIDGSRSIRKFNESFTHQIGQKYGAFRSRSLRFHLSNRFESTLPYIIQLPMLLHRVKAPASVGEGLFMQKTEWFSLKPFQTPVISQKPTYVSHIGRFNCFMTPRHESGRPDGRRSFRGVMRSGAVWDALRSRHGSSSRFGKTLRDPALRNPGPVCASAPSAEGTKRSAASDPPLSR